MTTEVKNLISIIVPCYNQAKFLPETLDSLLAQTYNYWECIIVNDGSPDNTHEIAESYCRKDARFRYFYKENGGLSSARNAGIYIAKGEFIQFLDSDDLISIDKLKIQYDFLRFNVKVGITYCTAKYFQDGQWGSYYDGIDKRKRFSFLRSMTPTLVNLLDHNCMAVSSPLIRRDIINRIGVFDEELRSFEDWDYWLRCIKSGVIIKSTQLSRCTTFIRIHGTSMSWNTEKMFKSYIQMIIKHPLDSFDKFCESSSFREYYRLTIVKNICFHIVQGSHTIGIESMINNINNKKLGGNEIKRLVYILKNQSWSLKLYKWYLIIWHQIIKIRYKTLQCKLF
jgi:glycosyltransferase involved in cell wall biosynthesis